MLVAGYWEKTQRLGNGVNDIRPKVQGSGLRVQGSGLRAQGSGLRAQEIDLNSKYKSQNLSSAFCPVPLAFLSPDFHTQHQGITMNEQIFCVCYLIAIIKKSVYIACQNE